MTTPQPPRWYCVNNMGMATLCADQADAEKVASDCNIQWPRQATHWAVQLAEVTPSDIVRACCEADRADPDLPNTICIDVEDLKAILEGYGSPVRWQAVEPVAFVSPDDSVPATERAARIAAQVENEALKAEREAKDAANLATATACADVCAEMAQQLRGHGDVAGAEIAEALRDAIRARGAT